MMRFHPNDADVLKRFRFLVDLIPVGRSRAVSMKTLSKLTDLPSSDVRQHVLNARKNGVLICSGDGGYYFAEDGDELKEFVNRRRKYVRTARTALRAFEDALKDQEEGGPA